MSKLIEEMSKQAIAGFDAETRFRTAAAWAEKKKALEILQRLDHGHAGKGN